MERSIRLGKDFNVLWSIRKVVDGERQPYELAGKELVLQYRRPNGTLHEAKEWRFDGNIIIWTFRGRDQRAPGLYGLILTENGGKDGMVTVDTCRAFNLVEHSCEETEGSGSDIVIEDVVLESEVTFAALRGPQGERGPEGPQGPQGERGPQGEQGPAGPSYDDTEIKGKLAELSAEINEKITVLNSKDYLEVVTDSEGKIIEAIKPDGTKVFNAGIENGYTEKSEERPDYLEVVTDSEGKIIEAIKPDGTKYIPKLETPILNQIANILYGKKYVAIGDSFTEGSYTGDDISKHLFTEGLYKGKNRVYPFYIGNRNKMNVVNMAVSGSCITTIADYVGEWPSVSFSYQAYKNIPTDADYITIKLGSNDAIYLNQGRISIGTIDSEDVTTFYGAWNVVLMHIIDNCPNAKIGFIITGHLTEELYEAEKAIAKKFGLKVLDFASDNTPYFFRQDLRKDVSPIVRQKRLEYYRVSETNIHPNDECQEFASTIIENFLRTL